MKLLYMINLKNIFQFKNKICQFSEFIDRSLTSSKLEQFPYLLAEHHYRGQDRGGMDHYFEDKVFRRFHSQYLLPYGEMSAAAYGKELGQTLDQAEKNRLPPIHYLPSLSLKNPIIATTSITMPRMMTTGAATSLWKLNIA